MGGNHLFRSLDRGDHWMIISPDLTTNDKTKYAPDSPDVAAIEKAKHLPNKVTGGITRDVTGAETHCTIITISESPLVPGVIWVGTDDGNVQLTRNGGATWTNVRAAIPGVPKGIWVSRVEASHFDAGTCYADLRRPPERRLPDLRLQDDRLRQDLDGHRRHLPDGPAGLRHPRGPQEQGPALPGHGVRRLRSAATAARPGRA